MMPQDDSLPLSAGDITPPPAWAALQAGLHVIDAEPGLAQVCWTAAHFFTDDPAPHAALLAIVAVALSQGHTCVPLDDRAFVDRWLPLLTPEIALQAQVRSILNDPTTSPVVGAPGDAKPLILVAQRLYSERLIRIESQVQNALDARMAGGQSLVSNKEQVAAVRHHLQSAPLQRDGKPLQLSDEQHDAVALALGAPLTLITGGPGTGKTSVVVGILRAALQMGLQAQDIALTAPTGKASQRLGQAVAGALPLLPPAAQGEAVALTAMAQPTTLHRLLGYRPGGHSFRHHENNPLTQRLIIVDEASMIDLFLMQSLLAAAATDATLVLLGDPDQLPSVQAGAAFRDMTLLPDALVAHLTHSYRVASASGAAHILATAKAVNRGDASLSRPDNASGLRHIAKAAELGFSGVDLLILPSNRRAQQPGLEKFLRHWFSAQQNGFAPQHDQTAQGPHQHAQAKVFAMHAGAFSADDFALLRDLFAQQERGRLLTATRDNNSHTSANAINQSLHDLFWRQHLQQTQAGRQTQRWKAPAFLPGEAIMVQRNDYDLGLWNGDQGMVLRCEDTSKGLHLRAVFARDEGFVGFPLDNVMNKISLAHALTVHKSQGSEYDHVALILPDTPLPVLSRQLIYTAITRCRRSATLVGTPEILTAGIQRPIERYTGLTSLRTLP